MRLQQLEARELIHGDPLSSPCTYNQAKNVHEHDKVKSKEWEVRAKKTQKGEHVRAYMGMGEGDNLRPTKTCI